MTSTRAAFATSEAGPELAALRRRYPLVKVFPSGEDRVFYDAKAHFAFVASKDEFEAICSSLTAEEPGGAATRLDEGRLGRLQKRLEELRGCGVFSEGPAREIGPVDRDAIRAGLEYFDRSIALRKFCLEVTEQCNFRCRYCRNTLAVEHRRHSDARMTEAVARRGIDYYYRKYTSILDGLPEVKRGRLLAIAPPTLSWYGGEPFLNFETVRKSAEYFASLPWEEAGVDPGLLRYSVNTNLSIIDDEILSFLVGRGVTLYASLDGPKEEHDRCRVFADGRGTFDLAYSNLLRIRDYDRRYFETKVTLFGVYTEEHDFERCRRFLASIGAFSYEQFAAERIGVFIPERDAQRGFYERGLADGLAAFKEKAARWGGPEGGRELGAFSNVMKFAGLRFDRPLGEESLHSQISCPMAYDNLMVDTRGAFHICHKTDGSMPVGDCDRSIDLEALTDFYELYNRTINEGECRSCWSLRFCPICAARRLSGGAFRNPTEADCDFLRLQAEYDFLCFLHLEREGGDLLEAAFDHRRDRTRYISSIDVNEL